MAVLILNLKIAGRPARDHVHALWERPAVQKAYRVIRTRLVALLKKDISVEEIFSSPLRQGAATAEPVPKSHLADSAPRLNRLTEQERQELEKLLKKASREQ